MAMNLGALSSEAVTVEQVLNSREPYVLVVYTNWAYSKILGENVTRLASEYPSITFKMVNMSNAEAKALFAKGPMTFAGFPYIQMARGKVGSYVEPDCAKDYACFDKKISRFFK